MNNATKEDFNVWPVLIDMITSVLIIFILYSFLDQILNQRNLDLLLIDKKRQRFSTLLTNDFRNEISQSKMILTPEFNYLKVTFRDQLLFPIKQHGRTVITREGQRVLNGCSSLIKDNSDELGIEEIQVEGHTDSDRIGSDDGKIKDNWDLSSQRAITITRYLTDAVDPEEVLFSANGFSKFNPIAENTSESNKSQNRRIELKIFFQGIEKTED